MIQQKPRTRKTRSLLVEYRMKRVFTEAGEDWCSSVVTTVLEGLSDGGSASVSSISLLIVFDKSFLILLVEETTKKVNC